MPPLSPSFHRHSFVSDIRSVPGGCSRFSRCCYLIIVLSSHRFCGSRALGVSRSHLDSAVELSCPDRNFLGVRLKIYFWRLYHWPKASLKGFQLQSPPPPSKTPPITHNKFL